MLGCMICNGNFEQSPDDLILCEHKDGAVHHGCCINLCSFNHSPCTHCKCVYSKE